MGIAVGISLAFHLVAVPVVFSQLDKLAPGIYNRIFEDTPLDVILVNASTDEEAPTDAQAIAQHNLVGGGNLDEKGIRATSPLLPSPYDSFGTELGPSTGQTDDDGTTEQRAQNASGDAPTFQQLDALQREQMDLLARVKQQLDNLDAAAAKLPASSAQAQEMKKKRQLMLSIVGEIERRINYENSRDVVTFGAGMPTAPRDFGLELVAGMAWLTRAL